MTTQGTGTVELRMLPAGELKGALPDPYMQSMTALQRGLLHAGVLAGVNSCARGHGAGGPTQAARARSAAGCTWIAQRLSLPVCVTRWPVERSATHRRSGEAQLQETHQLSCALWKLGGQKRCWVQPRLWDLLHVSAPGHIQPVALQRHQALDEDRARHVRRPASAAALQRRVNLTTATWASAGLHFLCVLCQPVHSPL